MTTIKIYENGNEIEIEVEDSFATAYTEMEHRDALIERKETRRHQSLNQSKDNGFDFKDESVDIERDAIEQDEKERLHNAIAKLSPDQRELISRVYFEGMTVTEVAEQKGISKSAISQQLKTIYKKLKLFL